MLFSHFCSQDLCGFYLMPYDILDTLSVRFGGMFATELDIDWTDGSYARSPATLTNKNGAAFSHGAASAFEWSLVAKDTHIQAREDFSGGPFPDVQNPVEA